MQSAVIRILALTFLLAVTAALVGCKPGAGHTRGMFSGKVIGKTEAEIVDTYGQPASVDRNRPDMQVITYKAMTFDPDNENKSDAETVIYMSKGKDGRIVASDILFKG